MPLKHYKNVLHIVYGVYGADLVEYINQSKIVLNLQAENEISWEPRVQVLLACSSMMLSHKITRNDYLVPGVDYIEVDNNDPADTFAKVEYFLEHDDERKAITENGLKKIQEKFNLLCRLYSTTSKSTIIARESIQRTVISPRTL